MTPSIESSPITPSTQPTRTERTRARPPTVQEIKELDRFENKLQVAAIEVPLELTCKILGYMVRMSNPKDLRGELRDLINVQRVSKGMRSAGRCLMLKSDEEWRAQASLWDNYILRHLHPGLAKAESQELLQARWGMDAAAADEHLKNKSESTGTANLLKADGPSKRVDPSKNGWRIARFDSRGVRDPQDWLAQASHVRVLLIDLWSADPQQLLLSLAPQLEALDMKSCDQGTLNLALTAPLFQALQGGKLRALGLPGLPASPQFANMLAELLGKLSQLESLTIRLEFAQGTNDTSWTTQLFATIQSMQKLSSLHFCFSGNGFDTTQETVALEAFRWLVRECRTLTSITAIKLPEEKRLVDPEVCRLLAENYCYAPRTDGPAQPHASQS